MSGFGEYSVKCPYCGKYANLYVVHFTANTKIPLHPDGFSTLDSKFFDTEDEIVRCDACEKEFPLSETRTRR